MPQKKNPDICELVRGKTGRVYGHLMGLLTTVKGLPLAYNKDLQEDKEGVFDTIDTLKFALGIYRDMIAGMKVNGEHTRQVLEADFSNATDMADYLAKKGLPFRQAHAVVGKAVQYCIGQGKVLQQLTMEEFKNLSPLFEDDIHNALAIETCIRNRNTYNGTGPASLKRQLASGRQGIEREEAVLADWKDVLQTAYAVLKE